MEHRNERVCPRTGRRIVPRGIMYWMAVAPGLGSIIWLLLRVIPKPSRIAYPCQRAAAATASGFLIWLLGIGGLTAFVRKAVLGVRRAPMGAAFVASATTLCGVAWLLFAQPARRADAYTTWAPTECSNAPIGVARGILPGRVVWAYDPLATQWDGVNGHWWDPASTDQARVDAMLSKSLQSLTGTTSDGAAWSALFSSFNQRRGRSGGYAAGQKIVIKINQNTARGGHAQDGLANGDQNPINGNPHVILSLLRQLVTKGGVGQDDIIVYDISRYIGDSIFVPCHAEFSGVHFVELDSGGGDGREAFDKQWVTNAITFAGQGVGRNLPRFVVNASYMINLASLKAHGDDAGPTLHAKNHYGTVTGLNHTWPNTINSYSFFVELMGSQYLGENTFLFMIDGLYGAPGADASPARFSSYPFSGSWSSSLLLSQDGVANESVGWDFINAEWGVPAGSDNTLREAAAANAPGSGTLYAPNGDGVRLPSLGVHEHWNNPIEKKYTRNLGTGSGIELVQLVASDVPIPLARSGWVASASNSGDVPSKAIDGIMNTRWSTGTARAAGQWFEVNMGAPQTFSQIVLDANGTTDFPGGYQVFVSDDGKNWGAPVATGIATGAKTIIAFPMQTATYFKVVATDSGSKWWSIYELNVFTAASAVQPPVNGDAGAGGSAGGGVGGNSGVSAGGNGGVSAVLPDAATTDSDGSGSAGGHASGGAAGQMAGMAEYPDGAAVAVGAGGNLDAGTENALGHADSGCSCRVHPSASSSRWMTLSVALAVLATVRRRGRPGRRNPSHPLPWR